MSKTKVYKFCVPTTEYPGGITTTYVVSSEDEANREFTNSKETNMNEPTIQELKDNYDQLTLQFSAAQVTACKLSSEREAAREALIKALIDLFDKEPDTYGCPHCHSRMILRGGPYGKSWMHCYPCGVKSPEFDGELEACMEWYRICQDRKDAEEQEG